ncbi:hypothetical protein PDO_2979 [Rhizobium sp. PDO1-076]|uniref:hypothetical protein n=1 Tax=Rhizobium sp. PDO1-076 TaxID=1125979 RepID=UPI00024E2D96|nr:hypothetical protein [Rhizobium sp. PDO1-076]EHS49772.1 hypothetical protein PDO_2979 [Rhizobium sp. PDO1-076]
MDHYETALKRIDHAIAAVAAEALDLLATRVHPHSNRAPGCHEVDEASLEAIRARLEVIKLLAGEGSR